MEHLLFMLWILPLPQKLIWPGKCDKRWIPCHIPIKVSFFGTIIAVYIGVRFNKVF